MNKVLARKPEAIRRYYAKGMYILRDFTSDTFRNKVPK